MSVRTDSVDDYLRLTTNLPQSATSIFTACWWCNRDVDRNNWQYMFEQTTNGNQGLYLGFYSPSNSAHFGYTNNSGIWAHDFFARQPVSGEWTFYALRVAGTGTSVGVSTSAYISRATDTDLEVINNAQEIQGYTPTILKFMNDAVDEWVNGSIAHVRYWDSLLTEAQLLDEKNSATLVNTSNINFVWRLSSTSDTNDISGNGRNPYINGTLANSGDPPVGSGLGVTFSRVSSRVLRMGGD